MVTVRGVPTDELSAFDLAGAGLTVRGRGLLRSSIREMAAALMEQEDDTMCRECRSRSLPRMPRVISMAGPNRERRRPPV